MNIKGTNKDTKHRLVVSAAFEQKGIGKNGKPMTGYNIVFSAANDRLTKKDIEAGKVQTAPMLAYNKYTDKNGKPATSFTMPYSKGQYDSIMKAANTKGDKPVIEAAVFPKNGGLVVNINTLETPKYKFDAEKHAANTELGRNLAAEKRAEKENQAQAEADKEAKGRDVPNAPEAAAAENDLEAAPFG